MPSSHPKPRAACALPCCGAAVMLLASLLAGAAAAQTRTWDAGGENNNWTTAGNWSDNNVPNGVAEAARFTDLPFGQTEFNPNLSADVVIGQLQYSSTAPGYTITGDGPATLFLSPSASYGGVGVVAEDNAGEQWITAAEVEFLSSQTWYIGGGAKLTATGTIEDDSAIDYGLTKTGDGTLVFPGDVRYDGPTFINGGALVLSYNNVSMLSALTVNGALLRGTADPNALGSSSNRNTITMNGGSLELANDVGQTFGHTSRLTVINSPSTVRSDRLSAGEGVTHTLGPLRVGGTTLTVEPGGMVTDGVAGITFGSTTLTGGVAEFDVAANAGLTLGSLSGNFAITKVGGGQLTLTSGSNRSSGPVTLNGGTLRLGNASALGSAGVPLTITGGRLDLATNGSVNAHDVTISGDTVIVSDRGGLGVGVNHTLGVLQVGAHHVSVTPGEEVVFGTAGVAFAAATLGGAATFEVTNNDVTDARLTLGAVDQSLAGSSITKTGSGTLALAGAHSYTGDTTVEAGTLALSNAGLADAADVYLSTGATLELLFGGGPDAIRSLYIDGVSQPLGTWGSLASSATHKSSLFAGAGLLEVTEKLLVGDYNGDDVVNAADYTVWRDLLGQDATLQNRDPLVTGKVSLADYTAWQSHYGQTIPGGPPADSPAVPEPAAWLLAAVASALVDRRRP